MAKTIQFKRGTTAQVNAFTGALGEVVVDTDKDVLVVHDGATQGGFAVAAKANPDGTISLINKAGASTSISSAGLFSNTLTSTATDRALTAAQGKVLQDSKVSYAASLGWNQTYQDVSASRVAGTTYTNSTGSPIFVMVSPPEAVNKSVSPVVDGVTLGYADTGGSYIDMSTTSFIVPNGSTYSVTGVLGTGTIWVELR